MKQLIYSLVLALVLVSVPISPVIAEDETILRPQVVFNEIQTNGGSGFADNEFIELASLSVTIVDITGWSIGYISTTGKLDTIFEFEDDSEFSTLYPGGYLLGVCKNTPDDFIDDSISPKFYYDTCLAASGAGLVLLDEVKNVIDNLYWVSGPDSFSEDIVAEVAGGKSIQRKLEQIDESTSIIKFTGNNKDDYEVIETPSPQADNQPIDETDEDETEDENNEDEVTEEEPVDGNDNEETDNPPDGEEPADEDNAPQITETLPLLLNELMIDPASPLTDADNEWVEIYNPNEVKVELSGYKIFSGNSYTYSYSFSNNESIEAKAFYILTSAVSNLALANSGSKVKIVSPDNKTLEEVSYTTAKTGLSYAKDGSGNWQWTTTPTEGGENIITQLIAEVKSSKTATAAKAKSTTKASTAKTTAKKATAVKSATSINDQSGIALVDAPSPLPVWLLATLGLLAVLYAGYEYRFDISNTIYKLRQYRKNR